MYKYIHDVASIMRLWYPYSVRDSTVATPIPLTANHEVAKRKKTAGPVVGNCALGSAARIGDIELACPDWVG